MNKPDAVTGDELFELAKDHFARTLKLATSVEHYQRLCEVSPIPQAKISPEMIALVDERLAMSQREVEGLAEILDMLKEMEQ